jgi:hypothetical protein
MPTANSRDRSARAPALRVCFLAAVTLLCAPATAQFGELMRRVLIGDTLAPPDHDTAYIISYRQKATLSLVSSVRLAALDITDTADRAVTWTANNAGQYGFAVDYRWLSVEATFSIPGLDAAEPRKGGTTSRGFGLGYTGRRLWLRGFWNLSTGFHAEEPAAIVSNWTGDQPWPYRRDLDVETWMGSLNYALSGKRRFSQVAALTQMERQQRSAGTWVAGAAFWITRLDADSTLVPTTGDRAFTPDAWIVRARRTLVGLTIGYTHTFVLWRKGFLHMALLTGAASSQQVRSIQGRPELTTEPGISSLSELRLGAGYNGDRWYAGLTSGFFVNADSDEARVSLGSTYGNLRLAAGLRFGRPNIKGIQRFGL